MTDRREQGLLRLRRRGDGRTAAVAAERSRADRRRGGAERDAPASLSPSLSPFCWCALCLFLVRCRFFPCLPLPCSSPSTPSGLSFCGQHLVSLLISAAGHGNAGRVAQTYPLLPTRQTFGGNSGSNDTNEAPIFGGGRTIRPARRSCGVLCYPTDVKIVHDTLYPYVR
jgi:hypothetical protein